MNCTLDSRQIVEQQYLKQPALGTEISYMAIEKLFYKIKKYIFFIILKPCRQTLNKKNKYEDMCDCSLDHILTAMNSWPSFFYGNHAWIDP